jgi:hypothetical protein
LTVLPAALGVAPSSSPTQMSFATDAYPQPHKGDPITLTHSTLTVTFPASIIQAGVDATVIENGHPLVGQATFVLSGSNTKEGKHVYATGSHTAKIGVVGGKALPLNVVIPLANTVWHPTSANSPVLFTEKSLKFTGSLDIAGTTVTAGLTCTPHGTAQVAALSAQSSETPTTTAPPVTEGSTTTTAAVVSTTGSSGTSSSLPRTGAETFLLFVLAAAAIDIGIVMVGATRRRMHQR